MHWQYKAKALNLLSRMPCGRQGYLLAQKLLGTTRVHARRDLERASELIELIRDAGQTLRGATCYEIGTGWHPFTPLALYLAGAERVITVDVNPWLSLRSARETVRAAEPELEWFATRNQLPVDQIQERFRRISLQAGNLPELLSGFKTEYIYPGDARNSGLAARSIDFVLSSNVLEHIPPEVLRGIIRESCRILNPGGLCVHRFNPGDHYANTDPEISTANFLRFSQQEWEQYGSGLAYHNRLRCSQFSRMFAESGLVPVIEETRVDEAALSALKSEMLSPHEDFAGFEASDLAADYMWYVGMQPRALLCAEVPAETDSNLATLPEDQPQSTTQSGQADASGQEVCESPAISGTDKECE